jgi:hypothetical protein
MEKVEQDVAYVIMVENVAFFAMGQVGKSAYLVMDKDIALFLAVSVRDAGEKAMRNVFNVGEEVIKTVFHVKEKAILNVAVAGVRVMKNAKNVMEQVSGRVTNVQAMENVI